MAKILVVDDSPTVLHTIENMLVDDGHDVYTARDALATVAALQDINPDVVLLDIMLAGVGGIELCLMIRHNPRFESTPIIMVTALQNQSSLAYHFGADGYITKPFSDDELLNAIDQHFPVVQAQQPSKLS